MKTNAKFKTDFFSLDVNCVEDFRSWQFTLKDNWTSCVSITQSGKIVQRQLLFVEPRLSLSFGTNTLYKDSKLTQMDHLSNFEAAVRVAKKMYERLLVFVDTPCMRVCAERLTIEILLWSAARKHTYDHHLYCSASKQTPIGTGGCSCKSIALWFESQNEAGSSEA